VYVCICHAVTDHEVGATIAAGARTAEEIGARCRAGTGCGSCVERLETMLETASPTHRVAYAAVAG
jgi:bacterioferritin-associated ferredoxin